MNEIGNGSVVPCCPFMADSLFRGTPRMDAERARHPLAWHDQGHQTGDHP
jgi:hypothetical protein